MRVDERRLGRSLTPTPPTFLAIAPSCRRVCLGSATCGTTCAGTACWWPAAPWNGWWPRRFRDLFG